MPVTMPARLLSCHFHISSPLQTFVVDIAVLSLLEAERQWFKAAPGIEVCCRDGQTEFGEPVLRWLLLHWRTDSSEGLWLLADSCCTTCVVCSTFAPCMLPC